MARAGPHTIEAFISKIEPNLVGHARLRRRLSEEMRGHLEDSAERYRDLGLTDAQAQRRAIEDFGQPEVVLGGWAESKGVGVPTTFTRYAGLAGIVGVLGLAGSFMYESVSEPYSQGPFAEVSMSFLALFAVSLVALYMRVRGKLVPLGRLGPRVAIAGFLLVLISVRMWFAPGALVGVITILVGLGAFFIAAMRSGVIPRGPIAIWLGGIAGAFIAGLVTMLMSVDPGVLVPLIGLTCFAVGWIWLGKHLWNQDAVDDQTELAPS